MPFSSGGRISFRVAAALLIPAGIVLWLLYAAASEEEATHSRNLRWLAQMATQIHDRVQNYTNFVRDRARGRRSDTAGLKPGVDTQLYSIENLIPPASPALCEPRGWKHLSVVDEARERYLRFIQTHGKHHECAQSDLKKLVESSIREEAFTSVILAQRNGRVLYQSGPESLRITDVSFLFDNPYNAPTASIHITRPIGDTQFAVFLQPLPILIHAEAEAATGDNDWLLIGLSEKRNLLRSSSPKDIMLVLPFVLLLLAMSWPLQRLWTLETTAERLRTKDAGLIVLCSLGCIVVVSLLGVAEYSRQLSKSRADQQLRAFAESIGANFRKELQLAVQQVRRLDDMAAEREVKSQTSILEHSLSAKDVYLPFEYVDWINREGEKTIRWTPKSTPPQRVRVLDRGYYQDIKSGAALFLPGISTEKFSIEQVLSRTSGQAATIIAVASKNQHSDVASIAVSLTSLSDPVAPKDLGFAVIDMGGKVLFHSERSRIFVENLFEECRQSRELSGIVSRRIQAFVNVDYAASPYRMFVAPIPQAERLPWTLVIFRRLPPNRVARMQVLVDTSVLLCVYAASLAILVALALRLLPRVLFKFPQWWTASDRGYPYVAAFGLLLLILAWWALNVLHDSELFFASLTIAAVFILTSALCLRNRNRRFWQFLTRRLAPKIRREHYRCVLKTAWLVWCVEGAVLLCFAPTLLLFKMSHEYETSLRMRDAQLRLWEAESRRRGAMIRSIEQIPGVSGNPELRHRLLAAIGISDPKTPSSPLYYYGATTSRIRIFPVAEPSPCLPNGSVETRSFAGRIPMSILAALEVPTEDRLVGFDARQHSMEPARNLWRWTERNGFLCLYSDADVLLARSRLPVFDPFSGTQGVVQASSGEEERTGSILSAVSAWLGLLALVGVVTIWMRTLRRRLLRVLNADSYPFLQSEAALIREGSVPCGRRSRLPVYAIPILVTGLVLFLSEEELTTRLIAFLTSVTAGFETIRKQLASFGSSTDETKKS